MWVYIWLAVTVLALVVEFVTSEFVSIWFIGGGIVSMILSGVGIDWYIHVPAFFVVSLVLLLAFRKLAIEKLNKRTEKTNAESVLGKEFKLLTPISFNQPGTIKVGDVVWSAVAVNDDAEIKEGTIVKIKALKGNKYIVEEIK